MDPASAIMLISALASLVGGGISAASKAKHVRELKKTQKERTQKADEDRRRAALQRAIRAQTVFKPRSSIFDPEPGPDYGALIAGLGQLGGQFGAQSLGTKAYPTYS